MGDIIQATSRDAAKSIESVPEEIIAHFEDIANELIESKGAIKALSAALAHISGYTSITNRSLLSSREVKISRSFFCITFADHIRYHGKVLI